MKTLWIITATAIAGAALWALSATFSADAASAPTAPILAASDAAGAPNAVDAATAQQALVTAQQANTGTAIFAGGCFWCTESDFEKLPGVTAAESGYIGGTVKNPSYEAVSAGRTGHAEAVRVTYDPSKVSYAQLVEYFWRTIDPTVKDQQFCDHGSQYRSAIFYMNDAQRQTVEASRDTLQQSGKVPVIYTQIAAAGDFYAAEEYHQDYYKKNPLRYRYYRNGCGRDRRLEQVWGTAGH